MDLAVAVGRGGDMTDCYLFTIFQKGDRRVKIKVFNFCELFSVHGKGGSFF